MRVTHEPCGCRRDSRTGDRVAVCDRHREAHIRARLINRGSVNHMQETALRLICNRENAT